MKERESKEPNKALEPTRSSGFSSAVAVRLPRPRVAQLYRGRKEGGKEGVGPFFLHCLNAALRMRLSIC